MRVSELIEILSDLDPNATVLILTQSNWPFENSIHGVTTREETEDQDENEGDDEDKDEEDAGSERGTASSDVFIVEGRQLRYGSKAAWRAAG